VNDLNEVVISNPELLRNLRIQLRPKRVIMAVVITGVVSLLILPAFWSNLERGIQQNWHSSYFATVLFFQALVLLLGGGIACMQSVCREKELNTFDYQRITRLRPLELTVGKLLGAPAMSYFITICLVPAALLGLPESGWKLQDLIDFWILLLFGAVAFHSFSLMASMLLKRTPSTGIVLVFLFFMAPWTGLLLVRGPYGVPAANSINFYGMAVPRTPFFSFIYAAFAAWFILALERNIKKDPGVYELLTPLQALGFAGWMNFIFLGIYPTEAYNPNIAHLGSMWVNVMVFSMLGIALLRNRDRARRRLRELGERGLSWLEAFWPSPYVLIGIMATGFLPLLLGARAHGAKPAWVEQAEPLDLTLFLFRLTFIALWLCRDLLYLQWMNLRPGRKPLLRAILYAFVYYTGLSVLFFTRSPITQPGEAAFQSIFTPVRVLVLDAASWNQASGTWMMALVCQGVMMFFFAFLHRQELQGLASRPKAYPTVIPPAMRPGASNIMG
jgi:hypothetical protein